MAHNNQGIQKKVKWNEEKGKKDSASEKKHRNNRWTFEFGPVKELLTSPEPEVSQKDLETVALVTRYVTRYPSGRYDFHLLSSVQN